MLCPHESWTGGEGSVPRLLLRGAAGMMVVLSWAQPYQHEFATRSVLHIGSWRNPHQIFLNVHERCCSPDPSLMSPAMGHRHRHRALSHHIPLCKWPYADDMPRGGPGAQMDPDCNRTQDFILLHLYLSDVVHRR